MTKSKWMSKAMDGLGELAECSFKNMCLIHHPPYRSLYVGGAGIAYTFWKAACLLDEPEWLHQARFWIDHVAAAPEDDRIQKLPEDPKEVFKIQIKDSLFFGNRGVSFTQALIAHSEDNPLLFKRALKAFTAPESERLTVQELMQGIAGRLIGCALLFAETGEERLKEHGDSLAEDLLGTAKVSKGITPWQDNHLLGLAHGRAGNYYALLLWSKETGYLLPEWIFTGLKEYAESGRKQDFGISWPIDERNEKKYMNSWCNGAPGLIHLWSLAYRLYEDPLFLETARESAEYSIHQRDHAMGHICCGAAGVSYALLSLNRIDPDGEWLSHTSHYFDLAVNGLMDKHSRLSLYRGLAGIVCLILDMENPEEAMQPVVEG